MAETVTACAIISCGAAEDRPPPVGKDLDAIYESLGVNIKDSEHAPYKDDVVARIHRKVSELEKETGDKDRKIKELAEEVAELKKELNRNDNSSNNDISASGSGGAGMDKGKIDAKEGDKHVSRSDSANRGTRSHGDISDDSGQLAKTFEATFYTAFCPTGCTGVTATGVDVSNTIYHEDKRIIAVDPSVIPLGSHVRVTLKDGTSFEATAQDTGGDIRGNRIDILVASKDEAYRLGRQTAKVEILN